MKRSTLSASLACALLVFSMLGCGTSSNSLQSIVLTEANPSQTAGGFFNLVGEGGTLQLVATGTYSSGKTKVLTNVVTWNVVPDGTDFNGVPLLAPPETVQFNPTGLLTAVDPFVCSWTDLNQPADSNPPAWFLSGSYKVVATFQGVASQPVYIAVASSSGNGPASACGPSS